MFVLTKKANQGNLYFIIGILFLLFSSCNDSRIEQKFFQNGKLEDEIFYENDIITKRKIYFDSGNLRNALYYLEDNTVVDTLFDYYDTGEKYGDFARKYTKSNDTIELKSGKYRRYDLKGNVMIDGLSYNGERIGWWKYYNEGVLEEMKYFYQKGDSKNKYNQYMKFDSVGNIIESKSEYFEITLPDTLYVGKSAGTLKLKKRLKECSDTNICIGYDLKPDYSNILECKVDTFYSKDNDGFFGVTFETSGKYTIRGFVYEVNMELKNENKTLLLEEDERPFEKEFYVVDRPDSISKERVMRYDIKRVKK
ncbi:hypothetical protein [Myroides guanonis]|uniref:MORN repeat variant n=1 Tax=Myroides guanonis TaxID=1150112 RepID=A0A1I3Q9S9_9FLAO|nr:hypothetical protein [Myroides guanonis]SFJ30668.1 hypothetical protein SAMN04487893_105125 [Myroides guanonis]